MRMCSVEACARKHYARGWCFNHYMRAFRAGMEPLAKPSVEDRFWAKVDKNGPGGCWLWIGAKNDAGYGQLRVAGRAAYAHRWSYERHVGAIPDGLHIDHLCRTPACVNPDHLEAVTQYENWLRGQAAGAIRVRSGEPSARARKPCRGCGGDKGPGKAKFYCDACKAYPVPAGASRRKAIDTHYRKPGAALRAIAARKGRTL